MKIIVIGAGSFVFGPTVLLDVIVRHRLAHSELVLVDLNAEVAAIMAGVGQRMAEDLDVACQVSATADRQEAMPDADFVILSASPQGAKRWTIDYEILKRLGTPDQARECGGVGGLSNALRSISLALDVCEDMDALCPEATLLDVTNPMPRVITAVHRFTTIRAYGFCNAAWQGPTGYAWLASLVDRPQDTVTVTTAGLNHFAWLVAIQDQTSGEDLYPAVETAIREREGARYTLLRDWLETYGGIAVSGGHTAEYLPFDPRAHYPTRPPYHGDAKARQLHWDALRAVADGQMSWRDVQLGGSWEHPVDVAVALDTENTLAVDMINLPNAGYLSDLPDKRIVEVPAVVKDGQVQGVPVGSLPGQVGSLCAQLSDVHELVAEGAAKGDGSLLRQAIEIDPAITDKTAALQALDEMLIAHRDLLPRF